MYQVKFIKHVHSCFAGSSSSDVWLERLVKLPFPPYKGVSIQTDDLDVSITDESEIYWKTEDSLFVVYVESNKEIYNLCLKNKAMMGNESTEKRFREIVEDYLEDGWTLREQDKNKFVLAN